MTGREPWGRYVGDDIEAVIAIMLLLENPQGQRIRPSQGDGGVDVMIPHSPSRWEVYQVKSFSTKLSADHKKQITKSWKRLLHFTREHNIEVTNWHVVRPIDPTHSDRHWLAELTADSNISTDWVGLSHVDGWAAKYPEVLDYYLHDGKETVTQQAMRFLQAASMDSQVHSEQLVEPNRALEGMLSWAQALNEKDPHFRYHFSTMPAPDEGVLATATEDPSVVFSKVLIRDGHSARLDVYERFNGAANYREELAEPLHLNLQPQSETEREALQDFFSYGIPFEGIAADLQSQQISSLFDFPETASMQISLFPFTGSTPQLYELSTLDDDGIRGPKLEMEMLPTSKGIDGSQGMSWRGTDTLGLASIIMRMKPGAGSVTLAVAFDKFAGIRPRRLLDVLMSLEHMQAGHSMEFRVPDGPVVLRIAELPEDLTTIQELRHWIELCECLMELQEHIPLPLLIPQVEEISAQDMRDWFTVASLLRGETVWKKWDALGMTRSDQDSLTLPALVRVTRPLKVSIGGTEWTVGFFDQQVIAGQWLPTDGRDGNLGSLLIFEVGLDGCGCLSCHKAWRPPQTLTPLKNSTTVGCSPLPCSRPASTPKPRSPACSVSPAKPSISGIKPGPRADLTRWPRASRALTPCWRPTRNANSSP